MPTSAKTQDAVRHRFTVSLKGLRASAKVYVEMNDGKWLLGSHAYPLTIGDLRDLLALSAPASPPPEYFDVVDKFNEPVWFGGPQRIVAGCESLAATWDRITSKNAPHRIRLFAEVGVAPSPKEAADV